jgi:hypothetical protein
MIQVNIGSMELTANHNINQIVEVCSEFEKRAKLIKHLDQISAENAKVLIFVATKRVADEITKYLRQDGWPALAIHGDKEQSVSSKHLLNLSNLVSADVSVIGYWASSKPAVLLFSSPQTLRLVVSVRCFCLYSQALRQGASYALCHQNYSCNIVQLQEDLWGASIRSRTEQITPRAARREEPCLLNDKTP